MVATTPFGALFLLLGGFGITQIAGAPLPLDPALSAVAPEECLWYASSAGLAAPDPNSSNQTEQLLAEPQVQRLLAEIKKHVTAAIDRAGAMNPQQSVLAEEVPRIVKAALTRPLAIFVEDVAPQPDESVRAEAGLVVNAGDQRADLAGAIDRVVAFASTQGLQVSDETSGGIQWKRVTTPPQAPPVRFGWKGDYFIVAVGDATAESIGQRLSGEAPTWLSEIRSKHPIEREASIGYVNIAVILQRLRPIIQNEEPEAWGVIETLGLTSIQSAHSVSGLDDVGYASSSHLVTDGQRKGLLGFLPYEPLELTDLTPAPKDALVTLAFRANPSDLLDRGVALASQFEPNARQEFEQHLQEVRSQIGVDVRQDIIGALGDSVVAFLPSGDLMTSWLSSGLAIKVKDASRLRGAAERLMTIARTEMARQGQVTISESQIGEHPLYSLQFQGEPVPVSPSWCITDDWLVVGLLPLSVRSAIERQQDDSLAANEAVRGAFDSGDGPAALVYQDTRQLVRSAYPFLQMGVQMISGPLRQQGFEIDVTALPSLEVISKHMLPNVGTLRHGDDGFTFESRGTLPGSGNAVAAAPIGVALLLPAVAAARNAAQRNQDMNNLKMLALGVLNYESAHREFPTDVYDDEGNAILSWRVRLLPFMEEASVSEQIRMDEPWDSEHNRQFHAAMPAVFQSTISPQPPGWTQYLVFKGDGTVFPGSEAMEFRNLTDGTSNTLLIVQASPSSAVNWMQPADIEYDQSKPFAGVANESGAFLAAFCDGHVDLISLAVGEDTMRALVSRDGGEPISWDELDAEPAPYLYPQYSEDSDASATEEAVAIP